MDWNHQLKDKDWQIGFFKKSINFIRITLRAWARAKTESKRTEKNLSGN